MMSESADRIAYLCVSKVVPGVEKEYQLATEVITIGRHPSNTICLPLESISRFHAKIQVLRDRFVVTDLKSSNGVYVNGERVMSAQLQDSDVIAFGNVAFVFTLRESQVKRLRGKEESAGESKSDSQTSVELVSGDISPQSTMIRAADKEDSSKITDLSLTNKGKRELISLNRRLVTLYKISEILRGSTDLETVQTKILDLVFEVIPAERGVVFNNYKGTNRFEDFEPIVIKYRDEPIRKEGVAVSRTILQKCIQEQVAILSRDPRTDARFETTESIILHNIKATMAVPMVANDRIMGVLHVDGPASADSFTDDDLAFLTTLCNEVAMNLENVRIVREMAQKDRLAAVGQTITGIAHNIKNILLLAQGGFELVEKSLERNDIETAKSSFGVAKRGMTKITNLVKDMLEYSRSQRVKLTKQHVNAIVADVLDIVRDEMENKGIELVVDLSDELEPVLMDEAGLHRAVENIVLNAAEAIEHSQGQISLYTFLDESGATVVRIEDNGKGIPKEYLEKIFEPFFTTKGSKGTGLGLAMTRKVVEDMGAKIAVESEEGEGTVFVIQFSSTATDAGLTDNDDEDTGAGH